MVRELATCLETFGREGVGVVGRGRPGRERDREGPGASKSSSVDSSGLISFLTRGLLSLSSGRPRRSNGLARSKPAAALVLLLPTTLTGCNLSLCLGLIIKPANWVPTQGSSSSSSSFMIALTPCLCNSPCFFRCPSLLNCPTTGLAIESAPPKALSLFLANSF